MLIVRLEAVIRAVRQTGVRLAVGLRRKRDLQEYDIASRLQYGAQPIGSPGVVQNRGALPVTGQRIRNDGRITSLIVRDRPAQFVCVQLILNRLFASPPRIAAGQIGLAVAVGIEQFGDFGIPQLRNVGDAVFLGCLFVDQVALQCIR